jgi:D-alanyl-D-alanine carboxypeptidase (penicillin-binding protein 5/6)
VTAGLGLAMMPLRLQADPPANAADTISTDASDSTPSVSDHPPKLRTVKPPDLQCASAILIDAISGRVLYEINADVQRPMASTTKIMTALLFCESVPDDAVVTASENACRVRDSSLHLKNG